MRFQVGDVVLLKSGGAEMTVSHEAHDEKVVCLWHNPIPKGGFDSREGVYPEEALETKAEKSQREAAAMDAAILRFK